MKPTPSDQVSEKSRPRTWSTDDVVTYPRDSRNPEGERVVGTLGYYDAPSRLWSVGSDRYARAEDLKHAEPSEPIKVGDWVRLKAQPDQDGIVTEIRESGTIVVFELVQRKASRPFDAVALQAWSFMVEHVPSKPEPTVYPHDMGPSVVVNAYPGEPGKEPAPALSPKARRLKQLEGEIATGILELLIVGQQQPTVETLREVTAQAKVVVRANAMFALTKLLPEGLFV